MTQSKRKQAIFGGSLAAVAGALLLAQTPKTQPTDLSKEWPTYGHDPGGMRFSPVAEITPDNVARLKVAWVYHMAVPPGAAGASGAAGGGGAARGGFGRGAGGFSGAGAAVIGEAAATPQVGRGGRGGRGNSNGFSASSVTPLVINGVMYLNTSNRVVALDPVTGKEIWSTQMPAGGLSTRGPEYWPGDTQTPAQIVLGSRGGKLYSLDAKTGKPNDAFGDNGVVDLNTQEILHGLPGSDPLSSPPTVYKNLAITGGMTQEVPALGPAGDVRAWDMHTGKLVWTFHAIPGPG